MGSTSQTGEIEGLPLPEDDLEHTDLPTFRAQQVHIIMTLRERLQNPPPSEFRMEDLQWTNHVTNGKGRHKGSKLAVILWDRLHDFISGEQHHPLYPCKFRAEVIRRNLPNSLRSPRAHSPALVIRLGLLSSDSLCYLHDTYSLSKQDYDCGISNCNAMLRLLSFYTNIVLWPKFQYEVV